MYSCETEVKVLHSAPFDRWTIVIEYMTTKQVCHQDPTEKWILMASGYELCIKIGSILVSHIQTHIVLAVAINNDRFIIQRWAFTSKR
jgi:hypothetical protein